MRKLSGAEHTGRQSGWGRFQIESAIMALLFLIPIFVSLAVPIFTRSGMHGREIAAIQAIKTIHTAEIQYQSQFGRFAVSLVELGQPASGAPKAAAAGLIGNDLANGKRQGYKFTVAAAPGGYVVNAVPVAYGSSGSRSFYSDQTMVLHENDGPGPATSQSKEVR
ncbi:MAG: pilin, type IV [Bryobacteraceae bacterium]